jgi:MFS family permease
METPPPVHEGHYSHPRFSFESQSLSDAAFGEASLEWREAAEVNGGRMGAIKDGLSSSLKSSPPPKDRSFYLSFTALCVCAFISLLDTVIIASALPAITKALHATSLDAYWCGTAFLFSKTIAQAWYSTYAFTFGHKNCLLVALAIFLIASIICATAQNIDWLIAGRVVCFEYPICPDVPSPRAAAGRFCGFLLMMLKSQIQGIGAGGVDSLVNVITSDLTSLNERGKYIGIVSMAGSMGLVTGVVMGAAIAEKTSWRL